jgi:hypothetical protein
LRLIVWGDPVAVDDLAVHDHERPAFLADPIEGIG